MSEIIFRMKFLEKKPFTEIAKAVGISAKSCYSIYCKAVDERATALFEEFYSLPRYENEFLCPA